MGRISHNAPRIFLKYIERQTAWRLTAVLAVNPTTLRRQPTYSWASLGVSQFIPDPAKCERLSRFRFYGYPCRFRVLWLLWRLCCLGEYSVTLFS